MNLCSPEDTALLRTPPPAVVRDFERVPAPTIERAALLQPALLADVNGRRGGLDGRVRTFTPGLRFAGSALTVAVRPGDNLMIHAALSVARQGDVLVIDGKADTSCALMGAIMMNVCHRIGIAGVVIDGAVRDLADLRALGVPVFAVAANPNGPTKSVAGVVNHPISVAGVSVSAGDFVTGDDDGVVVIARADIERLISLGEQKAKDESARIAAIGAGRISAPWLASSLKAAGID